VLAGAGLLLALAMVVLLTVGRLDEAMYYACIALVIVGLGLFGLGERMHMAVRPDAERKGRRARQEG
jgi:hypothetical protein